MPDDPDRTPPQGTFSPDETPTLVTCLACGGSFQKLYETATGHRMSVCRWCTLGSMTARQIARWQAHRQGRNR